MERNTAFFSVVFVHFPPFMTPGKQQCFILFLLSQYFLSLQNWHILTNTLFRGDGRGGRAWIRFIRQQINHGFLLYFPWIIYHYKLKCTSLTHNSYALNILSALHSFHHQSHTQNKTLINPVADRDEDYIYCRVAEHDSIWYFNIQNLY